MEPFIVRYRNLLVLLVLLVAQIIGLAVQVRRTASGRVTYDTPDGSGVRLIRFWASEITTPPERVAEFFRSGAGSVWQNYFALRYIRQENKDLQATVDRLRLEQAALLEDARQGQRLQALLKFQEKYLYSTVAAQVIGTSGSDLSRVLYIDKGKDDGIARDMAVITADGIVGKVRDVFPHTAQVLAINDQSSGAGVILEKTRIRGILRGNAEGQPQIVGILADQRIQPGENVLTAGGDQIFPRGLPVGVVEKVEKDPDRDGFIHVIVKPAANLDRLDEVAVITSIEPRFSAEQAKDIATSESEKGAEAAALLEQRKASEIMAERLPGLTDPNAPKTPAQGAPGATGAGGTAAPATPAPKILPTEHPDRFSPGYSGGSSAPSEPETPRSTPGAQSTKPAVVKPPAPKASPKQDNTGGTESTTPNPAPRKPQSQTPSNPQPQRKP